MKPGEMPELVNCFEGYFVCSSNLQPKVQAQLIGSFRKKARPISRACPGRALACCLSAESRLASPCLPARTSTASLSLSLSPSSGPRILFFTPPTLQDGTSRLSLLVNPMDQRTRQEEHHGAGALTGMSVFPHRVLQGIRVTSARHPVPDGLSTERRESSSWVVSPP
jgi:hypothetical protein